MSDQPTLTHPETGGVYTPVTAEQVDALKVDGWQPLTDVVASGGGPPIAELRATAEALGVDVPTKASKTDIAKAIDGAAVAPTAVEPRPTPTKTTKES